MLGDIDAKPSCRAPEADRDAGRDGLLTQGRAVLTALGERRLAQEFCRRAQDAPDREAMVAALLDCLVRRRPR